MTVVVGLMCKEGVVFSADRLVSHGLAPEQAAFGHYEEKIWTAEGKHFAAMVTGSGSICDAKSIAEKLLHSAEKELAEDEEGEVSVLRDVKSSLLEPKLACTWQNSPSPENVSLLFALSQRQSYLNVYRTDNLTINTVRPNRPDVLGIGENSLVRYLIDRLFSPNLSLVQTCVLATLLIYEAKNYCSQYCGGPTDVYALRRGSEELFLLTENEVQTLEDLFKQKAPEHLDGLLATGGKLIRK